MSKCLLRLFNKLSKSHCLKNTHSRFAKGKSIQAPKDLDWIWNSELVNYDHVKIKPVSTQYPRSPIESQNTRLSSRCCATSNAWQSLSETSGWFIDFFPLYSAVIELRTWAAAVHPGTPWGIYFNSLYVHMWITVFVGWGVAVVRKESAFLFKNRLYWVSCKVWRAEKRSSPSVSEHSSRGVGKIKKRSRNAIYKIKAVSGLLQDRVLIN